MENRKNEEGFKYTYSATEQDEIKKIRQKYEQKEEDTMTRLRKLDAKTSEKATVIALVLGVIGALVLGSGMSVIMTDIGTILGIAGVAGMIVGIIFGIIGIVLIALAYPVYGKVLKKEREKIAPEILRLTEELMR
jgi:hypothetical protein